MIIKCILPWPIIVTYAIICTGHPIFKTCHTIITSLMLLSTKIMLLSHSSCYYQRKSWYYQTTHAIIHKTCYYRTTCAIIRHLNNACYYQTHHVIIRHLMLLSTPQPIILTLHIILLFFGAALAHRSLGRALARLRARVQVQVRKKFFGLFLGFSKTVILNMIIALWLLTLHCVKRYFLGKKSYLNQKLYFLK